MKRKKKKWVRRVVWLILLALVGGGVYFIGLPMVRQSITITYDTYTASIGNISNDLSFSGVFALKHSETLTASSAGTVRAVYVAEGDRVASGQRLMRLSSGDTVKASMDGTINTLDVEVDQEVSGGQQLCQVADFSTLSVSARVDEYDIGEIHLGQACTITATSQQRVFSAEISSINYVSQSTGNVAYYTATADVQVTEGVYPGMQATMTIPRESAENVVILRMDALSFDRNNEACVYMKGGDEEEELRQVPVELGVSNDTYVEIKSGLKDGDTVYVEARPEESATGFAAMFGTRNQFNQERGNRGNGGNWNRGNTSGGNGGNWNRNNASGGGGNGGAGGMPAGNR